MKANLPNLNKKRMRLLFDHVYDMEIPPLHNMGTIPAADRTLLLVIKSMQIVNLKRRTDECVNLFHLFNEPHFLEQNSEGTTWFLAMALAIKELFSLEDMELKQAIFDCH
jgi:hypothetical protein